MPKESWNEKRECSASRLQPVSAFLPGKWKAHDPWSVRCASAYNTKISSRASSCLSTVHTSICVGDGEAHIQSFRSKTFHSVTPPITHVFYMSKIKHRGLAWATHLISLMKANSSLDSSVPRVNLTA